ncbi:MAG: endonuclease/exonuclease/phosphatase family protein [Candidatus Taylorbacteria bacterium]|nr:endonuclease/exonuclease/phosphatase family protein [Candidatus Taylorbacteria bacterium]
MIRFATINIQGDTYLDSVVPFLSNFKPDVVCFQEIVETSVPFFEKKLGMKGYFVPVTIHYAKPFDASSPVGTIGVGLFSSLPVTDVCKDYYVGGEGDIPRLVSGKLNSSVWHAILRGTIHKNNEKYVVATTHFTWTHDGSTSDKQREDLVNLLKITEKNNELILCGDFNAPRGQEIFGKLSEKYKDNIPLEYTSSLDTELHRIGKIKQLMVDGLFTTPHYKVTEAKLSEGVSDHKAVTAIISKVK